MYRSAFANACLLEATYARVTYKVYGIQNENTSERCSCDNQVNLFLNIKSRG